MNTTLFFLEQVLVEDRSKGTSYWVHMGERNWRIIYWVFISNHFGLRGITNKLTESRILKEKNIEEETMATKSPTGHESLAGEG